MQGRPRNVWFSGIFRPGGNTKKAAASARSIATADFSVSITNRRIKQYVKTVVPAHKAACPAYVTKRHQSRSSDLDATLALCICLLGFPMTDFRQRGKKHSHPYSDWYRPGFSPDSLFTRHAPSSGHFVRIFSYFTAQYSTSRPKSQESPKEIPKFAWMFSFWLS